MAAAIPILIAVTAATATYSAVSANQQKQDAKGEANKQKDDAAERAAELKAETLRDQNRQAQLSRHRAMRGMGGTFAQRPGGTILTSPIGSVGSPTTGAKSLVGQ